MSQSQNLDQESQQQMAKDKQNSGNLNDIQSEVGNSKVNNNKILYLLFIGIIAIIAIICISLSWPTWKSIFVNSKDNSNKQSLPKMHHNNDSEKNKITNATGIERWMQEIKAVKKGSIEDKSLGLILGSIFGDVLGVDFEFWFEPSYLEQDNKSRRIGNESYQVLLDKQARTYPANWMKIYTSAVDSVLADMQGGGFYRTVTGQSSDDTAMALQLTRGLINYHQKINSSDAINIKHLQQSIVDHYYEWANPNENGDLKDGANIIVNRPFDIGVTIGSIYIKQNKGLKQVDDIIAYTKDLNEDKVEQFGNGLWSNGALMRIYPLAIYCLHLSDNDVYEIVKADVALTNNNPMVTMTVTTYVLIARELIKGKSSEDALLYVVDFLEAREQNDSEDFMAKQSTGEFIKKKPSVQVAEWIEEAISSVGKEAWREPISLIDIPFKRSIYHLFKGESPDFKDVMRSIILEAGDTDTNAAIVGAVLGADYGIHDLLELSGVEEWLRKILACTVPKHPFVLDPETSKPDSLYVQADFNPYLGKHFIISGLWKKLIEIAPRSLN